MRHFMFGLAVLAGVVTGAHLLRAQDTRTHFRPRRVATAPRTAVRKVLDDTVGPRDLEPPARYSTRRESALVDEVLDSELLLALHPRHSKILRSKVAIQRVSIADPEIVKMNEFDPYEVELIGGATGQTTMTLWMQAPDGSGYTLRYLVRCLPDESREHQREYEYALLQDRINEFFPTASRGGNTNGGSGGGGNGF